MTNGNLNEALPSGYPLGDFRIESELGRGSFGITYRAVDTELHWVAAIKEFFPVGLLVREGRDVLIVRSAAHQEAFHQGLQRFKEEARNLAKFRHPNVVGVQRYLEANGSAYLVMDYRPGRNLTRHLRKHRGMLDQAELLQVFLPLLGGLREVHRHQLLHRDIKPDNIYLADDAGPMLIDFGAARQAVEDQSGSMTAIRTPGFAPPEQYVRRSHQGAWTDLYAIGADVPLYLRQTPAGGHGAAVGPW